MSAFTLLCLYSLAIAIASLVGGWVPNVARLTHTRTQTVMSFVAGLMLGVAILHLLPHGIGLIEHHSVDTALSWMLGGLVMMFLLIRVFHFHQHDFTTEGRDQGHHDHDTGERCHEHSEPGAPVSGAGVLLGMGLHTIIDGIALGAALLAVTPGGGGVFAIGVFAAILLHKPLDALAITAVLQHAGWSPTSQRWINLVFALICPIAAILFFAGVSLIPADQTYVVGAALAFCAGIFICISLSDLLPEIQFHSHDSLPLTIALMVGLTLSWLIGFVEPAHYHP